MPYVCPTCKETHDDLPDMSADKPDPWWNVAEEERAARIELTSDTCIIDGEHHFIRGVIEIPLIDAPKCFGFGVWISLKKENFVNYVRNFNSAEIGPFFGWLYTRIAYYPQDTLLLKTQAHFRGSGLRPTIELEPTDHPLAVQQRSGISLADAWAIVHHFTDP